MNVQGINVNFDRIMRITFWYGAGDQRAETVIVEYAPRDNEAYCPDIKVSIKDILNPTSKNGLPGFTAQITLTNPHPEVLRILANHITWVLDYTEIADKSRALTGTPAERSAQSNQNMLDYYASRVRVRVEAGYWHEGMRNYNLLFEGYVNSNSWYRKGTDNILVLAAYNVDVTQMSTKAVKDVGLLGDNVRKNAQELAKLSLEEASKRNGKGEASWATMAGKLVLNFSGTRPNPAYAPGSTVTNVPPYIDVAESERSFQSNNWYKIKFIYTPREKSKLNPELEQTLRRKNVERFYTTASGLDNMLSDLANYDNANVNYEIDDTWEQGIRTLFVWPRGKESEFVQGIDADIKIVNYQNIMEAPALGADGSLNVKMLFNPACKPGLALSLVLDESQGSIVGMSGNAAVVRAGRGLNDGLSFQGNPSPYYPSQQGARSLSLHQQELEAIASERLKADKATRGYVFNVGFPMREIEHTLATRGNDWYTTVKTIPMNVGLMKLKA